MNNELYLVKAINKNQTSNVTKEFQPGELYIIAGRPQAGKTNYIAKQAWNICKTENVPALLFSFEMKKDKMLARIISVCTGISGQAITNSDLPLYISDEIGSIEQISKKIKMFVEEKNVRYVFIDYLQLIRRESLETQSIITRFKQIAEEQKIVIIVASQINRMISSDL